MEDNRKPGRLKNIGAYMPRAVKFYGLKNEILTPVVFIISLGAFFLSAFIPVPYDKLDLKSIAVNFLLTMLVNLASTIYLSAYIRELKGEEYSMPGCVNLVLRNILNIIMASVVYSIAIVAGVIAFIIPGIIFSIMFIFNTCYILDQGKGPFEALGASRRLTGGCKWEIFSIMLVYGLLLALPLVTIMVASNSSDNTLVQAFVPAFIFSIVNIMQVRLIALLYVDLEYTQHVVKKEDIM